jgi:hypothetical protein
MRTLMTIEPFSRRYGFRHITENLVYDAISERIRTGLLQILREIAIRITDGPSVLRRWVCYSLREKRWSSSFPAWDQVEKLIYRCKWYEFFDVCEEMYRYLENPRMDNVMAGPTFETQLNQVLSEEGSGYRMFNGLIERMSTPFADKQIHEVRQLLRDARFEGPNMHFEKAIAFLNQRPSADTENCIKEAASALESIGKILSGETKESFGAIYKKHFKDQIPKPLNLIFENFWGYASGEGGIRHASIDGTRVPVEEAEFCLVQAASMIRYLIQKFGKPEGLF